MSFKQINFRNILLLCYISFNPSLFSQFILPEENYTTNKDIDVIRVDTQKIDVRNLKAKIQNSSKGEVLLSWTVVNSKDQLAVVRSDQAISRLDVLTTGKVITLLEKGSNSFRDIIISPGDYYYAVVSYPGLKNETVILKSNDNFTPNSVRFDERDLSPQSSINEAVSNIQADIIDNKSVRVRWNYEPVPNASLLIYRSTSEIKDEIKLKNAIRIGSVPAINNYYDDQDGASGDFYYAVIVLNPFGIEKVTLKAGQTYTTKPIKKPEVLSSTVRSIQAVAKGKKTIFISWTDPNPQFTDKYIIYRSFDQILLESDLQGALIVNKLDRDFTSYVDRNVPNGEWHYAVLTQNKQGTIQKLLTPGENSMVKAVLNRDDIKPEPTEEVKKEKSDQSEQSLKPVREFNEKLIYDLQALSQNNAIYITWKPSKGVIKDYSDQDIFYHIFRFTKKPETMNDLSTQNYIAKIPVKKDSFIDTPGHDGLYYYALFLTTPKGVLPTTLKPGDNLIGPVIFKKVETDNKSSDSNKNIRENPDFSEFDDASMISDEKLNGILRRTYLQENYSDTILELKEYRKNSSVKIRAKANFYSALSNYYLKQYDTALQQIMESSVKQVYKDRADFWYRQILEKMTK